MYIAYGHLGEILQGALNIGLDKDRNFLMSLPAPCFISRAKFTRDTSKNIKVIPVQKTKVKKSINLLLNHFNVNLGGTLEIESNIPEGKGAGSSTADCVASIRTISKEIGTHVSTNLMAKLLINSEGASDSTFNSKNNPIFFAQNEGKVLQEFTEFPEIYVTAFDTDPLDLVDTLKMKRPKYTPFDLGTFQTLQGALRYAIKTKNFNLLSTVSIKSAMINNRFLPKKNFDAYLKIATKFRSGLVVAHSGTLAAFLINPNSDGFCNSKKELQKFLKNNGTKFWNYII